jgi:hypothetical protein
MAERGRFEREVAAAFRAYLEDAPTQVRPVELARHFATTHPHGRTALGPWRLPAARRLAWILLLAAGLLAALVGGTLLVGSQQERRLPALEVLSPDEALVADLAALMSNPYDAARVVALYAPDAVIHDMSKPETSTGLVAIQLRVKSLAAMDFRVTNTSAAIRQDDFVAVFSRFGTEGDLSGRALVVYELKDGRVLNQWIYPAP